MLQYLDPAFVRQKKVGDDQVELFPLHDVDGLFPTGCRNHGITRSPEEQFQGFAAGFVVIDQQDAGFLRHQRLASSMWSMGDI